jgi:hypothetical protein
MITLIILIVIIGVVLWLVETYVPMSPPIKIILRVAVVIILLLYILRVFGIADIPVK